MAATVFLTDATTPYSGTRGNAPDHLSTAIHNGCAYAEQMGLGTRAYELVRV